MLTIQNSLPIQADFVGFDVAGEVAGAGKKASVVLPCGQEFGGDVGGTTEEPHLFARADGDCSWFDGDAHRAIELMKCEREPILPGADGDQVASLIGGN